jgi:hypothetical protein
MRNRVVIFLLLLSVSVFLNNHACATRSRLMGMGDLSTVIEDESNIINLWDFAGNPAGLLADERGSILRADFSWDAYNVTPWPCGKYPHFYKCEIEGDLRQVPTSMIFRREGNFALALEGDYLLRQTDFKETRNKLTRPEIFLIFSKSLGLSTAVCADFGYAEYSSELRSRETHSAVRLKTSYFRARVGAERELSPGVNLAALLGYESMDSDKAYYTSNFHTFWASLQCIVQVEQKLKLGSETVFNLRRADYWSSPQGNESYYFARLRLRGIYDLTTSLRLGVFFFHNELFSESPYPVEAFLWPVSPDAFAVEHLGFGCSYKFYRNLLVGLEFHFRNSSEPDGNRPDRGSLHETLNFGVEGKPSEAVSLRGGYIRTGSNRNPVVGWTGSVVTRENAFTLGLGYQRSEWNLVFDLSYRYAFRKFRELYVGWDIESGSHGFWLSLKKVL